MPSLRSTAAKLRPAGPRGSLMPRRHGLPSLCPADVEIAARLNHEITQPGLTQDTRRALDRVAFPDAAQVHAHALAGEKHGSGRVVDLDSPVVDERQARSDRRLVGNAVVLILRVELPDVGQRSERDVELAVRPLADLAGGAQHRARIGAHRHRTIAGRRVDAQHIAAGTPDAEECIEPVELAEHRVERRLGGRFVGGRRREAQFRPIATPARSTRRAGAVPAARPQAPASSARIAPAPITRNAVIITSIDVTQPAGRAA